MSAIQYNLFEFFYLSAILIFEHEVGELLSLRLCSCKGSFTPSDYVAVTVMLTGGAFHLDKQIKGAARQRYGDRYVIARCE